MIQRIQTVYFFLGAVLLIVFSFTCDNNLLIFTQQLILSFIPALASILVAFLSLIVIFLFKKRNFQTTISSLLILLVIGVISAFIYNFGIKLFYLEWSFYLLPLALIFLFLGRRSVVADEKLIKSVDRLR